LLEFKKLLLRSRSSNKP